MTYKISSVFAKTITAKHNQHITMVTVGQTGTGKSNSNIRLAYNTACKIAEITGGKWSDYFSMNNVAIIKKEEVMRVMEIKGPYPIKLFDDIGTGWKARKWQSEENDILNDIAQTMRTENGVTLLTLPSTFMLDKIPRSLSHYFMEMVTHFFDKGISVGKLFELKNKHRMGKTFYQYLTGPGNIVYKRIAFRRPPAFLVDEYEAIRKEIAEKMKTERMEEYNRILEKQKSEAEDKPPKLTKKEIIMEIKRDFDAGIYPTFNEGIKMYNKQNPDKTINGTYARHVVAGDA